MAPRWQDRGWWPGARALPSPNFDARPAEEAISLLVVHSISLPPGQYGGREVEAFFTNALDHDAHPYFDALRGVRVSAHFFVRRDGTVLQFVSCLARAWHAGASVWQGRSACNSFSIGVEMEGLEGAAFELAQYEALARLMRALRRAYPLQSICGHEHIAPGRKADPGAAFDWSQTRALSRWPRRMFHGLS
jgi:N-acetyl-anhydromuramoyl-L-alanine amidase